MAIISIGGVDLPDGKLTGLQIKNSDMDSSNTGRSESGYMTRDRIRENVASLVATFEMLTDSELNLIRTATNPASLSVTYLDAGISRTKTMMRSGDLDYSSRAVIYWDCELNLIEY